MSAGEQDAGATPALAWPVDGTVAGDRLLFWLDDTPCLAQLADLRMALPRLPEVCQLPHSPDWLYGIFPLETELAALADPRPVVRGPQGGSEASTEASSASSYAVRDDRVALVIGEDDTTIALIVDRLGEVYPEQALLRLPDGSADIPEGLVSRRYVAGWFAAPDVAVPTPELRLDLLLADILSAIEERDPYG